MRYINKKQIIFSSIFFISSLVAEENLFDEDIENLLSIKTELKATIGSRDGARDYLTSNSPVDVITNQQIENSGLTSLTDVLRYFVAGFNAPETSIADGSDHIRAYTLRGMNPDQILVLINGKRVHTSALLHVNGIIGRGSSHVDLDNIPLSSIDKVEILMDGAAAQYGSDAIAGVINITLKGIGYSNKLNILSGIRKAGDGKQRQSDLFMSIPLKYDGFINITLDMREQNPTQRAGLDYRLEVPRVTTHVGILDSKDYKAILYSEVPQDNDINIYSQLLFDYKESKASAFFRPSSDKSISLYQDGFLPIIKAKITDSTILLGVKGEIYDSISWDLSNSYGLNHFHYFVEGSMNYYLDANSPTSFDNGSLNFIQNTTTLDLKKDESKFKIAGGVEFRYENYQIKAGEVASYIGTGSEGYAGYKPENEVNKHRHSYAIYVDNTYNFTKKFVFETALRYEDYSDFGESTNGKLALSYKLTPTLMLRASGSTGFRAPSLAQSYYSQTSSFVNDMGILTTQGTFRVDHEVSKSLGATDLKSERSQHVTMGTVFRPNKKTSLSVECFYIDVNNKILLTPEITATTPEQQEVFRKYNVSAARFFTNAARMTTQGVNLKINSSHNFQNGSNLDVGFWYSYSKNDNKKSTDISLDGSNTARVLYEDGQPKSSLRILTDYKYKNIETTLNISRYGSYYQMLNENIYKFDAKWTTDINIAYDFTKNFRLSFGGINIFDTMPNRWDNLDGYLYGTNGIEQYSRYTPFGYSGAYYYLKASIKF